MISYMKEQQKPPSRNCKTLQEVENRIDRYYPTIIGVFDSKKSKFYEEYIAVANYLRSEPLKFIHTFDRAIAKGLGVEETEGVVVRKAPVFVSNYEKKEAILRDVSLDLHTKWWWNKSISFLFRVL